MADTAQTPEVKQPTEEELRSQYDLSEMAGEPPGSELEDDESTAAAPAGEAATSSPAALPAYLVDRALQAGLSVEQLKRYQSAEALEDALRIADMQVANQARRQRPPQQQQQAPPQRKKLTGEHYSPELKDYLEQMEKDNEALQRHVGDLTGALKFSLEQQTEREIERFTARVDDYIAELPEAKAVLGEGRFDDIQDKPQLVTLRKKLAEEMGVLADAYQANGRKVSEKELFRRAFRMLHGDATVQVAHTKAREEVKQALKEQAQQITARPTQKPAPAAPKGVHSAVKAVQRLLDKKGWPGGREAVGDDEIN